MKSEPRSSGPQRLQSILPETMASIRLRMEKQRCRDRRGVIVRVSGRYVLQRRKRQKKPRWLTEWNESEQIEKEIDHANRTNN